VTRNDVVWVTLESTRYDHTSLGGYNRETTPNLGRMADAEAGRSFGMAFSHGIWTLASSASILTGTHPAYHGTGMSRNTLPGGIRTMPERFRQAGYRTIGFSSVPHVGSESDLDRGFEEFRMETPENWHQLCGYRSLAKYLLLLRRHGGGYTTNGDYHAQSYLLTEGIKRELARHEERSEPLFLYAHYSDTHHPYVPPLSYLDRFHQPLPRDRARDLALDMTRDLTEKIATDQPFTAREWRALEAMYDATIAYVDSQIGSAFEYVQNRDDTILVVTADHGELLGEEGLLAHKITTHDAVCHVPLVVYGPTGVIEHESELVQPIDVIGTLAAENGADTAGLQGRDLGTERREHAVVQRGWKRAKRNLDAIEEHAPEADLPDTYEGDLTTLRTPTFKLEYGDDHRELFLPPHEGTDRGDRFPAVAERLGESASAVHDMDGPAGEESGDDEYSPATKERLRDLGYVME